MAKIILTVFFMELYQFPKVFIPKYLKWTLPSLNMDKSVNLKRGCRIKIKKKTAKKLQAHFNHLIEIYLHKSMLLSAWLEGVCEIERVIVSGFLLKTTYLTSKHRSANANLQASQFICCSLCTLQKIFV